MHQEGNHAQDFGNLTVAGYYFTACASSTRGVFLQRRSGHGGSGYTYHNTIDYVTISTQGNAADFGDATATGSSKMVLHLIRFVVYLLETRMAL